MKHFADRLEEAVRRSGSHLCLGFDPVLENLPTFAVESAELKSLNNDEFIYRTLVDFHKLVLEAVAGLIACVKPNIAFFEQYGIAGLRAFASILSLIKDHQLPVIVDGKRGDIGSTAQAYSNAFLGGSMIRGARTKIFDADALTVNPYLGFETLEGFLKDCQDHGKGIFALVKTSNPGSGDIQDVIDIKTNKKISERVGFWLAEQANKLMGECGFSGVGAVVGATYAEEAKQHRKNMPRNLLLIPGVGAQGASAKDIVETTFVHGNLKSALRGALINVSRGVCTSFSKKDISAEQAKMELKEKVQGFNSEIAAGLA